MNGEGRTAPEKGPWGPWATAALTVLIATVFSVTQFIVAIPYLVVTVAASPKVDIQAAANSLQTDSLALRPVKHLTILLWLLYTLLLGILLDGMSYAAGYAVVPELGNTGAVLLASLLWASVHVQYEWFYIGQIFILGLLLGAARLWTRSLLPPILMHALFSGVATLQVAIHSAK